MNIKGDIIEILRGAFLWDNRYMLKGINLQLQALKIRGSV
jgi:hypothetical protein